MRILTTAALLLSLSPAALAQTGVLDQVSPNGTVGYSSSVVHQWQQQVRAAISGQLEGVDVYMYGFTSTSVNVRIRVGDTWNTSPAVFAGTATFVGTSPIFVDMTSANIQLDAGDTFVLEIQGDGSQAGHTGSYVNPSSGPPLYPEPLYLNAAPMADGGFRLAFRSYMLAPVGTESCFGVGCPCGNDDSSAGCANSEGVGARLQVTGGSASVGADDLELTASSLPPDVFGIVFMGSAQVSAPFGDGRRCAGGTIVRFPIANSGPAGTLVLTGPAGLQPSWITQGSTWHFQGWYRDTSGPCGNGTNLTNVVSVTFQP